MVRHRVRSISRKPAQQIGWPAPRRLGWLPAGLLLCIPLLLGTVAAPAQSSSSSQTPSSASGIPESTLQTPSIPANDSVNPVDRPEAARIERGGAAISLETNESLFQMAVALNACGYNPDLDRSAPVRAEVRADVNAALQASESARESRDDLCAYIAKHHLSDVGEDVSQYVSLALYLSPPPELMPNVDLPRLPPQAADVVNVLPLLRNFAQQIDLHYIWIKHRPEYEALLARIHDPMTDMILQTNFYLHKPPTTLNTRRFLVLVEPMFSPNLTNARVYGSDYIIVVSPDNRTSGAPVNLDQIRHVYLHYVVEPLVYSRGQAMEGMQPLLETVQSAPLPFFYKSDIVALMTECVIKAIEAHLYLIPQPPPKVPGGPKRSQADVAYQAAKAAYDEETTVARDNLVLADMRQGWILAQYFYNGLTQMQHSGQGLSDVMAPLIYGMDVQRQKHAAEQILFVKSIPPDPLSPSFSPTPHKIQGVKLAERDLMKGDIASAETLAQKALKDPSGDHAGATYLMARIDLMQGNAAAATKAFQQTLTLSQDPRTLAWSHIYLGRLYDVMDPPQRDKAIAEYKQALVVRDGSPDTKQAAENGIARPFLLPQQAAPDADNQPFDPTGKAEKEAYKPSAPQ
ncbi:MAG: tetratricopeptide repeat protein [Acidobacteriota bacterium]